jgi:hypothetical protein
MRRGLHPRAAAGSAVTRFTEDDLDRAQSKPRPRGTLPYMPEEPDIEQLRDWLTLAFRPPAGWRIESFERSGTKRDQPCSLMVINGREHRKYRFRAQGDLVSRLRTSVSSVSNGMLRMPHLTMSEIEDVWAALCTLGRVLDEQDEPEQARDWIRRFVEVTKPLLGYSLVRESRHDALMALKQAGEFALLDALAIKRAPVDAWPRYPVRLVDEQTGENWVRAGEAATFLRHIVGVEPLSHGMLRARFAEIGIRWHHVEDRRPPHPKLTLYRVPEEFVEGVENG